jgi:hypothetical protein
VNVVFVDDSVHAGDVHVVQARRDHYGRVALEHGSGSFYHKAKIVKSLLLRLNDKLQ